MVVAWWGYDCLSTPGFWLSQEMENEMAIVLGIASVLLVVIMVLAIRVLLYSGVFLCLFMS